MFGSIRSVFAVIWNGGLCAEHAIKFVHVELRLRKRHIQLTDFIRSKLKVI